MYSVVVLILLLAADFSASLNEAEFQEMKKELFKMRALMFQVQVHFPSSQFILSE